MRRLWIICAVILSLLPAGLFPEQTWAGGLYLYEVSPADVGLASAGTAARAQDASTLFSNPAGMTRIKQPELVFGLTPIYSHTYFKSDSNTSVANQFKPDGSRADSGDGSGWIPTGSTFFVYPVNKDLAVGLGVFGFFGLSLKYNDDWEGRYYVKETTLQGLTIMPSIAYKVNDWLSVGAGLNVMYGMLKDKIAVNNNPLGFGSVEDGEMKLKDETWGFGGIFGVLVEPIKNTRFGLTYMTPTELDFNVKPKYSGLRPAIETILRNNGLLNLEMNIPVKATQTVMLSGYHEINDRWASMGNIGWQDWSEFGKVDVTVSDPASTTLAVDMKYKDTWHAAAGVQYKASEPLLLSLGLAYDSSIMDDSNRSPSLPAGETWRFGTGAKYRVSKNIDLAFAYEFLWIGDLQMDVNRGPIAGRVSGEYSDSSMHVISMGLNWRF